MMIYRRSLELTNALFIGSTVVHSLRLLRHVAHSCYDKGRACNFGAHAHPAMPALLRQQRTPAEAAATSCPEHSVPIEAAAGAAKMEIEDDRTAEEPE